MREKSEEIDGKELILQIIRTIKPTIYDSEFETIGVPLFGGRRDDGCIVYESRSGGAREPTIGGACD